MLGAIVGDIIGSCHERGGAKIYDFPLFISESRITDDTVLTVATAEAILKGTSYEENYLTYGRKYPTAGYGKSFVEYLNSSNPKPYNSWGNGSAMRVSPIGYAFGSLEEVMREATKSAEVTHNHPEGIKGAIAIASAVFFARNGSTKEEIKSWIQSQLGYNLERCIKDIRPSYTFDVSCQGSVPEAILCFLESKDVETSIRLAISLGGDSDTLACMAAAIAEPFYGGIPSVWLNEIEKRMDPLMWDLVQKFLNKFLIVSRS